MRAAHGHRSRSLILICRRAHLPSPAPNYGGRIGCATVTRNHQGGETRRRIVLAAPRAECAGVERAIEAVERVVDAEGPPVYVRRQIVHNTHVVSHLERRGVVFVDEVDQVPHGATLVFSAHGVSPQVRAAAAARSLQVIDATCPLVRKVHVEARTFVDAGYTVVLVGHAGHDEVEGTQGEAPENIRLVTTHDDVRNLEVPDPDRVAYLTQTTLAIDDTKEVVSALRHRFPGLVGPRSSDICYASQNRQDAVKVLAAECDIVLVVGSDNSSNSRRLVEVCERHGTPAHLIEDESAINPAWVSETQAIGLTGGASAPESVIQQVLHALLAFGPAEVVERRVASESVRFKLPDATRSARSRAPRHSIRGSQGTVPCRRSRPAVRAVLLDAYGTLLMMDAPSRRLQSTLNRRLGVFVANSAATRALAASVDHYRRHHHEYGGKRDLAVLFEECANIARPHLGPVVRHVPTPALTDALLAAVRFRAYPDAPPALRALRDRGLPLIVVSNANAILRRHLREAGLVGLVDEILTSEDVGAAKPATPIFHRALQVAGDIEPHEALHVGDEVDADILGARSCGIPAIHLAREGNTRAAGVPTIASLAELTELIAMRAVS